MAGRPKVRSEALDVPAIVAAAMAIARSGLDNLTMRSLADQLQVSVGALYKHVSGREELLDLVVDHVLEQAPQVTPDGGDGWAALRARVLGIQELMDRYPGLDEAVVARSPRSPTSIRMRREGMAALGELNGLTADEASKVYRAVTWLWLGSRVHLDGRQRRRTDIDTFTEALDILIVGLRQQMESRRQGSR
ncbi:MULTISPECIES: TetR/AcrR family transcriptional regulator [Mycolicibacterium]|jgi:AcrR family transcriptional regulator|uniref:TetR/AcrR family transcriptional regulator n=1 Tax=Mycolicibacterium TaxID=1866885 RepID=UPI00025AD4B0|nr:TetR/AcrR family transcriptional regulator [Mycolicibacterium phlei]EID11734.1 regulatory protein TetR [Mycolicibacterium phlei RIVM601174]MBF4193915.1 regulatory protein TetR [Mycolicibacterium phlei]